MFSKFRQRSQLLENIDTGNYTAEEYEGCLTELQFVNKWMGDSRALRVSLLKEIDERGLQNVSILDVGAGSGELLRVTATWCRKTNRQLSATGLELNARSAIAIRAESENFPEISGVRGDALLLPFRDRAFDYVISSLFTHHFSDDQIVAILREMKRIAARGLYVIDLHRHPVAHFLYTTAGRLVLHNRLLREDGALSILRSFKADELFELARRAELENITVQKRFPYRLVLSASANRLQDLSDSLRVRTEQAA